MVPEEEELEYVELEDRNQFNEKKSRYLEEVQPSRQSNFENLYREEYDDRLGDNFASNQIPERQEDFAPVNRSNSRKPISNLEDPLDVEPITIDNPKKESKGENEEESFNSEEIEDPW